MSPEEDAYERLPVQMPVRNIAAREVVALQADTPIEDVGRLAVVARDNPRRLLGFITRGDVLAAQGYRPRLASRLKRSIVLI